MNLISDKFSMFSPGRLTDTVTVLKIMAREGISNQEFCDAVHQHQKFQAEKIRRNEEQIRQEKKEALRQARIEAARTGKAVKYPNQRKQRPEKKKSAAKTMSCPKCGKTAYAQSVCPNCTKGKAGIKNEYICGDCNFVFYV